MFFLFIVYRYLKPSNIFVDLDGHVRMEDFFLLVYQKEEANTPMTGDNNFLLI